MKLSVNSFGDAKSKLDIIEIAKTYCVEFVYVSIGC